MATPEDPSWVPEYVPEKAYTKDTIRQLQDVDPETLQNTANPDFLSLGNWIFQQLTNTFLGGARTVFDAIVKWINQFIASLLDAMNGLTFGIFNLGPLADRFRGTEQKVEEAQETAMTAVDDAAAAAALAAANEEANAANAFEIAEAKLQIGTKADPEEVPTNVPGWVTLQPLEDATFPRTDLAAIPTIVNGNTSSESGEYGYHTHKHNATITWVDPVYTAAVNRYDIGYINATRARIYNTVGVVLAAQNITGVKCVFRIHLYKMGKDTNGRPNGTLTRLWSSDSLASTFGTGAEDVRVEIGTDIVAAKGDWFAVLVHQTGSGTPRNMLGKQTAAVAATPGVHPTRLAMNRSNDTTVKDIITPDQLDTSSTWVPWFCLGQTMGLIRINLIDLFDRADSGTLGSNWAVFGIGCDIRQGVAQSKRPNYGNFATRTEFGRAIHVSRLSTDSQSVSVKLTGWDRSNVNIEENPRAQVACRANSDMSRCVTVGIRWGIVEIRAYSGLNPGGVTKNSTNITWAAGDQVELTATDAGGTGPTTYLVRVNGAPVLEWTDTAGETARGPANRRCGFEVGFAHRGAIFTYVHIPSVGIDEWRAKDL